MPVARRRGLPNAPRVYLRALYVLLSCESTTSLFSSQLLRGNLQTPLGL
jgi:hypothetical protein